jgi:biofilm PGA synthesis N-glycosyltransferase PgaC
LGRRRLIAEAGGGPGRSSGVLLLITPARNEAAHIVRTARALEAQTRPPDLWVVVDDGSDDATPDLLRRLSAEIAFLRVVTTPRGHTQAGRDRLALAAEARAFNWALAQVDLDGYTHIGKLDADIELPPEYFERLLERFGGQPGLGIAGGMLLEPDGDGWRAERVPEYHVRGALKLYTRACFDAIGGIDERLGWDTMDETYARLHGFGTRSFGDLVARHHRPEATADGALRGRARHGQCAYILHYGLPWVVLRSFKEAGYKPVGLTGVAFLYGYLRSAARRDPRVEDEAFRRLVRRELRERLRPTHLIGWATGRSSRPSESFVGHMGAIDTNVSS